MMRSNSIKASPKFLWFLMLVYIISLMLSNWFDARLIQIGNFITDGGILVFATTYMVTDIITEVYGYKFARLAIWCAFLFNAFFIFLCLIISSLPSPSFAINNDVVDKMLVVNFRIFTASAISYLFSEPLNAMILAKLKIKMKEKHMWFRFLSSTFIAAGVESFLFTLIAFYGPIPSHHLLQIMLTMWICKVVIEFVGLPLSLHLAKKLKLKEQLDIYDIRTKFNLFNLDSEYPHEANHFKAKVR